MKSISTQRSASPPLHALASSPQAARHGCEQALVCPEGTDELEIDIDREIDWLERRSGVKSAAGHGTAQARAFVAWIATVCADAADRGDGCRGMRRAAAVASYRHARAWRQLASLLSQRCATLVRHYDSENADASPGDVVRWLFADLEMPWPRELH